MPFPGKVPEIFAPSVVSDVFNEHSGAVFSPDGKELFWTSVINEGRDPRMVVVLQMRQVDGVWLGPELASFNRGSYNHINSISPDGDRLYFFSETEADSGGAWVVERVGDGWGEAQPLPLTTVEFPGVVVNEVHETRSGNLYFSGPLASMPGGRGIVRSRVLEGVFQPFESLGREINLPHSDWFPNHSPMIDPEERFLIFVSTRPGGFSEQDLYVSFRNPDNTWGSAMNLGPEINAPGTRNSWPQLSPDGRFLFFVRTVRQGGERPDSYAEMKAVQGGIMNGWGNIYWVDAKSVEALESGYR
jgi:hypothetical protein